AAYLLSEAKSLREIAYYLRDNDTQKRLDERITALQNSLESLWNVAEKRYVYRDRDTHLTTGTVNVVQDAHGMDELIPALKLSLPNRLIVKVAGGMDFVPQMTLFLTGFDQNNQEVKEDAGAEHFIWSHGRGVYTSRRVFAQIDQIRFESLSRAYRIDMQTMDTTRSDINGLLPLWSAGISQERANELITTLSDPERFWRPSGVTMCS